jgi:hypothetical protein
MVFKNESVVAWFVPSDPFTCDPGSREVRRGDGLPITVVVGVVAGSWNLTLALALSPMVRLPLRENCSIAPAMHSGCLFFIFKFI